MANNYGGFDPGSYHFSDPDLLAIINKTSDAINEMNQLNNTVMSHTELLGDANRSDSGRVLTQHITTWTSDFHKVVGNLEGLNTRAQGLLQVNRTTDTTATHGAR
ncbi:hypothetical protein [Actinoallomurus sp. NPDC050550]|uniref:hypothetical protein n=1 Tax=Actinoallomurus sp. NPDC050550 TaxID=3154937 RepID=UPI0033F76741